MEPYTILEVCVALNWVQILVNGIASLSGTVLLVSSKLHIGRDDLYKPQTFIGIPRID